MFGTSGECSIAVLERSDDIRSRADLSAIPPSGWSAIEADMALAQSAVLDDDELLDVVVAFARVKAWAAAREAEALARFAERRPAEDAEAAQSDKPCPVSRYAADELGLALRLSRGTASVRVQHARRLDTELVATRQAWRDGLIDETKVRAVLDATVNLTTDTATAVQDRVLARAPEQTAGQLRAALGRAVVAADPQGTADRQQRARAARRVAVNPEPDGMASLWALLPAPDALSAYEWLTRLARGMGAEDPRTMDARRADLLTALVTGRLTVAAPEGAAPVDGVGPTPIPEPADPAKPLIQIVIPYDTLTGAAEHPAELVGYGAIPAPLAREIAADGVWNG